MIKQGTPEWHAARRGKITSTGFAKVLSKRGNTRQDYMRQLILERKTGVTAENFTNEAMEWGKQNEPLARVYYEKTFNLKVTEVGFVDYKPKSQVEKVEFANYVGVSPDGFVKDYAVVEIKCPDTKTHLEYIAKNVLPSKYKPQVQGILWVTGRKFCDFISFDPRVEAQPFWCINVERDEDYINKLAAAVSVFIDEMIKMQVEVEDVDPQLLIDVTAGCSDEEWAIRERERLEKEIRVIRGKCLHGYAVAQIEAGMKPKEILTPENKADLLALYMFVMTGE
jgi:putative phage-type endonuclease